ncbi:homoserine kinase [Empedobacter brevis]|uniref:homoserine kinase n=1 Tax=Empedobacter brevis TaxID=247 RepID=UPI0028987A00|nr:homoserine kinase [Empedobacter brevis]
MNQIIESKYKLDQAKILEEVHVFAPATVANMICGFDILGFAVDEPGDEVIMRKTQKLGIVILKITGDDGKLPLDAMKNTVSYSAWKLFCDLGLQNSFGLSIELHKKMPIGSGLGSSAASTVAGIFALNELLGQPLSKKELLPYCMEGERLACGAAHADNVAPSLFGGITLIPSYEPLLVRSLPVPENLYATLIYSKVEVPTKEARKLIKDKVQLSKAIKQWGNIASLISALYENDYDEIGRSMQDEIIEPNRSLLIPFFDEMKQISLENNALTFGISGSGPTVMALTKDQANAERIEQHLHHFLHLHQIEHQTFVSKINERGPYVKN